MQRRRWLQLATLGAVGALSGHAHARHARAARVIVIGGGFAGASCALTLRRLDPAIEVTLIEPDHEYVTCPRSNAVLGGLRTLQSLTVSLRGLDRAGITCVRDQVIAIDAARRQVRLRGGQVLRYDRLVFAAGIRMRWDAIAGYDEAASLRLPHAWKAGAQTSLLARQLRDLRPGGTVAICVPPLPYRCPPGPYERASLIAHYLKIHNARAKVLIFDANNRFSKQPLFVEAWQARYAGMIEWIPVTEGGAIDRVDVRTRTLYGASGAQRVDIANVIPPQAPPLLAVSAGLAFGHGWCPVDPRSFESTLMPNVHVIGDACIANAMPKSASAANSQAKQCALSIIEAYAGRAPPEPVLHNTCYSEIAPDYAISVSGIYRPLSGALHEVAGAGGMSPIAAPAEFRARESAYAEQWYRSIVADSFGA